MKRTSLLPPSTSRVISLVDYHGKPTPAFMCPACRTQHVFGNSQGYQWDWNLHFVEPTFRQSLCHVELPTGVVASYSLHTLPHNAAVCHSIITSGKIRFLAESRHKLRGQLVNLPVYEVNPLNIHLET